MEKIRERAARLNSIVEHPGWKELRDEFNRTYIRSQKRWHKAAPIDVREFDYFRGYWAGIMAVLDTPEKAMEQANQAWAKAQTLTDGVDGS